MSKQQTITEGAKNWTYDEIAECLNINDPDFVIYGKLWENESETWWDDLTPAETVEVNKAWAKMDAEIQESMTRIKGY